MTTLDIIISDCKKSYEDDAMNAQNAFNVAYARAIKAKAVNKRISSLYALYKRMNDLRIACGREMLKLSNLETYAATLAK